MIRQSRLDRRQWAARRLPKKVLAIRAKAHRNRVKPNVPMKYPFPRRTKTQEFRHASGVVLHCREVVPRSSSALLGILCRRQVRPNGRPKTSPANIRTTSVLNPESAILTTLAPRAYTAIVRGKNSTTGVALVEAYQLEN